MKTATLTEMADQLRIPRTTLTEWKNQFDEYIPSIGEGRGKRYVLPEAIKAFQSIATMKQANMNQDSIATALQQTFSKTIQVTETQQPTLFLDQLDVLTGEIKKSNELKERELEIRLQEIQEQRLFRQNVEEMLTRRQDDVTQMLVALRDSRNEIATTTERRKWWPFGKDK
jgi:hypothetical protein